MNGDFYGQCLESGQEAMLVDAIRCGEIGIDEVDDSGRTPLMVAVEFGNSSLASVLLALGAQPDVKGADGTTCLSCAVEAGDVGLLTLLIDAGADLELEASSFLTPLALAAVRGNVELVALLIARGASTARTGLRKTILSAASEIPEAERHRPRARGDVRAC